MTFGEVIAQARKDEGFSQKEVASKILKEDGIPISAQYLNDIEHDRRNPPGDHLILQFSKLLDIDQDYLFFLAGRFPSDVLELGQGQKDIANAIKAFRRRLAKGER